MSAQEVEDLILFGKNAKRILEDPIFIQVMQTVRDDIHLSWSQTNPSDSEDREQYYNLLKSMDLLEEKLWAVADNAQIIKIKSDKFVNKQKGV